MSSSQAASPETQRKRKRSQKEKESTTTTSKRQKGEPKPDLPNGLPNGVHSTATTAALTIQVTDHNAEDAGVALEYERRHKAEQRKKKKKEDNNNQSVKQVESTIEAQAGPQERSRRRRKGPSKKSETWNLTAPIGGRFIQHDTIFSNDEKHLFAANSREVQVFSNDTSLLERTIPAAKRSSVSAFALSAADPHRIYIASASGSVQIWDWTTGALVAEPSKSDRKITALAISCPQSGKPDLIYYITTSGQESHIVLGDRVIYTSDEPIQDFHVQGDYVVATTAAKIVVGKSVAPKSDADGDLTFTFVEISAAVEITCLATRLQTSAAPRAKGKHVSAESLAVAVGCASGQIFVYEDLSTLLVGKQIQHAVDASVLAPRILHWHRESVGSLKWSKDGNYLISGGRETVLVIWQLQTGKKQFLPHLTAEIERLTVSPSGSLYGLQFADNSLMVLSTSELQPVANFAGLQVQLQSTTSTPTREHIASGTTSAAALHPYHDNELLVAVPHSSLCGANDALTASRPFLQTFDMSSGRHISRQALTRNMVTDFNKGPEDNRIQEPDVALIQISHDGEWLATVEQWTPPSTDVNFLAADHEADEEQRTQRREVYLKIWRWNGDKKHWMLETRLDSPHQVGEDTKAGRIFALVQDPAEVGFATVGEDSCLRIWKPKTRLRNGIVIRGSSDKGAVDWSCRHAVRLESGPESPEGQTQRSTVSSPNDARLAYSDDGSTIAVSQSFATYLAAPAVHFVNTASGDIVQTRSGLFSGAHVALGFLNRYMIALSSSSLSVWDVVDETLQYRVELESSEVESLNARQSLLAINHENNTFAVAMPSKESSKRPTRIQIYGPGNSKPIFTRDMPQVVSAILTNRQSRDYTILTASAEIMHLSPRSLAHIADKDSLTVAPMVDDEVDVSGPEDEEMDDAISAEGDAERMLATDDDADGEKAVVRPEELAQIFDVGQSFALMPVKAMFEAVVGLYGRKLRTEIV